jgi:uncharacterized oligopeptide transporter (OPT) family protein
MSQAPYIPPEQSLPEITFKALLLGVGLSVLLAGANAYLGLKAGITVSASIPAAVISMAALRLFKRSNILENNIVQTAASAGESLAAGVIFTIPALVLLGHWSDFNYLETTIIAGLGGMLGVLFTIPIRRALIIETPLIFPEGVATAEVLKVGDRAGGGILFIVSGAIIGALFKIGESGVRLWAGVVEGGRQVGSSIAYWGTNVAPALVAVGYIVGINIAVLVFVGGAINWYVAIPILSSKLPWPTHRLVAEVEDPEAWDAFPVEAPAVASWSAQRIDELQEAIILGRERGLDETALVAELAAQFDLGWEAPGGPQPVEEHRAQLEAIEHINNPVSAHEWANRIWSKRTRYIGVGAMVVGGLWALLRLWPSLVRGIASGMRAYRKLREGEGGDLPRTERDTPMQWVGIALAFSTVPLFLVFYHVTEDVGTSLVMAVLMLIAGFLFSAVASYMAGLVGSSNNPISGVTIATILTSALLLLGLGTDTAIGPAAAILIGGVVCCAAAIGGDNMQDLKAGRIVGATPYKQQIMQAVGVLAAALVMAPVLTALLRAYGIGEISVPGQDPLEAPQATLMASVARGVFAKDLPWTLVFIGMGVAVAIIAIDFMLERAKAVFRAPVLAVAVGIYLPLELSVPIFVGGLISFAANRFHMRRIASEAEGELKASMREVQENSGRNGLLMAAGLITGEAILGILLAIPLALWEGRNKIAESFQNATGLEEPLTFPGLLLLGVVLIVLYRTARGR